MNKNNGPLSYNTIHLVHLNVLIVYFIDDFLAKSFIYNKSQSSIRACMRVSYFIIVFLCRHLHTLKHLVSLSIKYLHKTIKHSPFFSLTLKVY